jgi:hypothetical protein
MNTNESVRDTEPKRVIALTNFLKVRIAIEEDIVFVRSGHVC